MSKNRKYSYILEQKDSVWNAKIVRQVTSKKSIVSKEQSDFASEANAKDWAEQQIIEFTSTLSTSNQRHDKQRKLNEEHKRQRSSRRAEKAQQIKQEKSERAQESFDFTQADADGDSLPEQP